VIILYGKNKDRRYSPQNYDKKYLGPVTLEEAFSKSLNTIAAKVGNEIGINRVKTLASEIGINSKISSDPSITLGTSEVTLLELTSAYAGFLNDGIKTAPRGWEYLSIKKTEEVIIQESKNEGTRIMSKIAAQSLKHLMYLSVENGTGKRATVKGWQVAGKTGTSQSFRDAWFVGFTNKYIMGVWMGNDDNKPLKEVNGGGLPAKIWSSVMSKLTENSIDQKKLSMITSEQFDILKLYEKTPRTKRIFSFDEKGEKKTPDSSLIGGLIRALLWGN
jgi:penicillin-binding protein 1A